MPAKFVFPFLLICTALLMPGRADAAGQSAHSRNSTPPAKSLATAPTTSPPPTRLDVSLWVMMITGFAFVGNTLRDGRRPGAQRLA